MPSVMPLLSSASNTTPSLPVSSKKVPKKLRRKNPPPSLSTSHQKLPSSAGSSTYSLPKSRPSSSKSNDHQGWVASPPTPHLGSRRRSEPYIGNWSPEDFPPRPPALPILGSGAMAPPMSGSPELNPQEQSRSSPRSVSSVYSSLPASSTQDHFPIVQQTIIHPPPQKIRGKGKDTFKAFSYDSYSNMPISPPPQSPPPNSIPPTYLGTAQYPNNLLSQPSTPRQTPRALSFTTPLDTNIAPLTPAQQILIGRTPNGSPILPPLPSFQSGGFGFDLPDTNDQFAQPKASPTYPARQRYKPVGVPPLSSLDAAPPLPQRRRPTIFIEPEEESPTLESPMLESPLVTSPGDYIFHALTAEEPIILPSSPEQTPEPSPPGTSAEFPQPSTKGRARRKSDAVSSFLGGWKLAMMGGGNSSSTVNNEKAVNSNSESDVSPVGVGDGGGWIHRRKGSFSSTRPPSREKSKHSAYAQEYRDFRAQKVAESVLSSKSSSKRSSAMSRDSSILPGSPVEGTGASAILGNMSTRERSDTESRQMKRVSRSDPTANTPPVPAMDLTKIAPSEVVSLDVAVRQINLLEDQLKKGRPLSPPDSRDGERSESDRGYKASSEYSQTNTNPSTAQNSRHNSADSSAQNSGASSPTGSFNQKSQSSTPRSSVAKQSATEPAGKGKSRSPLRNEVDSESVSSNTESTGAKERRERLKSPRHSASSAKTPSEYLGKPEGLGAGLESGSGLRPTTPPKPVAKLFVICCRCKYWHDLPSIMYRGMVENGGATRCPYCLHGMEVSCCAGYTCVVYMHQRHH